MAKAKKRVAARKKSSKRGKANAKPARKMAAKQATPTDVKPKPGEDISPAASSP
jgi:hypothetical protein